MSTRRGRRPSRDQLIAALEVILEALREGAPAAVAPLVEPSDSRAGRACPVHLRELVRIRVASGRLVWRCPVQGCREEAA